MYQKSIALAAAGTLSLIDLDGSSPIGIGLSAEQTSADSYTIYGTLDSAATTTGNAATIMIVNGVTPVALLQELADKLRFWPYILSRRGSGTNAGTLYLTGNQAASSSPVSTAAPVSAGAYSALLNVSAFAANGVRIGGDRNMLATDAFDVFVTQDPAVTTSDGCQLAARIYGGGDNAPGLNSILVKGFPYVLTQRALPAQGTGTAGSIIAYGITPPTIVSGSAWTNGGNAFGAPGSVGTTDAQPMSWLSGNVAVLTDDLANTTLGRVSDLSRTTVQSGSDLVLLAGQGALGGFVFLTPGVNGAIVLLPKAAGAGNTTGIRYRELSASGSKYIEEKAPDAITATQVYTKPATAPARNGQNLRSTTAGVQTWFGMVLVRAANNGGQSIADGGGGVVLTNWTKSYDLAGALNGTTGVFTPPVDGYYAFGLFQEFSAIAAAAGAEFTVRIALNGSGSTLIEGVEVNPTAAASVKRQPKLVTQGLFLTTTDIIDFRASQNSGSGAVNLTGVSTRNQLSIALVG